MTISEITEKMIAWSDGNLHDISHFLKVWAYAKTIGAK
jgi:HD superfamily phosphodiesterase